MRVPALVVGLVVGATLACSSTGPTYTVSGTWYLGSSLLWLAQSGASFAGYDVSTPDVNAPTLGDTLVCGTVMGAQVQLTLPAQAGGGEFIGTFRDASTIIGTLTVAPSAPRAATMTKGLPPASIGGNGGIGQVSPPSHC